jgi:hypothetical protein
VPTAAIVSLSGRGYALYCIRTSGIPLPRTSVNKGIKKGRSGVAPALSSALVHPTAPFLKDGTQKCVSDASAVSAADPTPRVLLDG